MSSCVFCQRSLNDKMTISFIFSFKKVRENQLCEKCRKKFRLIDSKNHCPGCSLEQPNQKLCEDCLRWQEELPNLELNHSALFTYNEIAQEFMSQFKHQGDLILAEAFSKELYERLAPFQKSHIILPVPSSRQDKNDRGFNSTELLLDRAGITYYQLLESDNWKKKDKNKILIVDDIYKSGRKILNIRAILEEDLNGIHEIRSFSLFR